VVRREHGEPARQQLVELVPQPGAAGRVQEQQRWAVAAAEEVDATPCEVQVFLGVRHPTTLWTSRTGGEPLPAPSSRFPH
jgi:hypothetical protein